MSWLSLFEWCNNTVVGAAIRESVWLFPAIEAVHLLALAVLGGTILLVDLRLCGWGLTGVPASELAQDAQPWLIGSLAAMLMSGALLFSSEALKCYANGAFRVKMVALAAAIVFTFTVRRWITAGGAERTTATKRLVAAVSVMLWLAVGVGGRGIGFY